MLTMITLPVACVLLSVGLNVCLMRWLIRAAVLLTAARAALAQAEQARQVPPVVTPVAIETPPPPPLRAGDGQLRGPVYVWISHEGRA